MQVFFDHSIKHPQYITGVSPPGNKPERKIRECTDPVYITLSQKTTLFQPYDQGWAINYDTQCGSIACGIYLELITPFNPDVFSEFKESLSRMNALIKWSDASMTSSM